MADPDKLTTLAPSSGVADKDALWPALPVPAGFILGGRMQVQTAVGSHLHGVIRWIGIFRGKGLVGLEMEEENEAYSDGLFLKKRLFTCKNKRALFIKWDNCKPAGATAPGSTNMDGWECPQCTLINDADRPGCEACSTSSPFDISIDGHASYGGLQNLEAAHKLADPGTEWVCGNCTLINELKWPKCELCREPRVGGKKLNAMSLPAKNQLVAHAVAPNPTSVGWSCEKCTLVNAARNQACDACGDARPAAAVAAAAPVTVVPLSPSETIKRMKDEVQMILEYQKAHPKDPLLSDVPENWAPMSKSQAYGLAVVDSSSAEYQEAVKDFNGNMNGRNILCLYRIQNPHLWKFYRTRKMQMKQENGGVDVQERRLFHGSDLQNFPSICKDNFDWRLSGSRHGHSYGQGTYFGSNAQTSDRYIQPTGSSIQDVFPSDVFHHDNNTGIPDKGTCDGYTPLMFDPYMQDYTQPLQAVTAMPRRNRHGRVPAYNRHVVPVSNPFAQFYPQPPRPVIMPYQQNHHGQVRALIIAKVLVGEYTQGSSSYKKPPQKPGAPKRCYDSCVDNVQNPGMFIIFDMTQMYPEYIIEYI